MIQNGQKEKNEQKEKIVNKYKFDELIKRGSFGVVFKGYHIFTNEPVAIKIENPSISKSLKHETRILNYLYLNNVRSIPSIYWYGLYGELPCLIIPYYLYSLKTYFERINKKTENLQNPDKIDSNISKIILQIIDILKHIHSHFIIHRDLKPDNFMINTQGNIILIDFGLATFYI